MGSDYQRMRVIEVDGPNVVVEVFEEHPDMDAIHCLVKPDGKIRKGKNNQALIFAAFIIRDHRNGENSFVDNVERLFDDLGTPTPQQLIEHVEFLELTPTEKSTNDTDLYHAKLAVTVAHPDFVAGFKPTKKFYYSRAYGENDLDDIVF